MHKKLAYIIKHNRIIQFIYCHIMSSVFRFIGLFVKTDNNLILFNSYGGERYNDSSKVLYETILKDERFSSFHFVWAFDNLKKFNKETCPEVWNPRTKLVKIDTLSYFVTALKAKVWITNVNIERGLHFKKKETIYLNTWHGTGPKKGGNAVKGRKDYDFSYVDILCVDGKYARDEMIKCFNALEKNLLYSGRPREDELFTFNDKTTFLVKEKLSIPKEKIVLLYMPTWREYGNMELNTELWEDSLSEKYIVLVRSHLFAKNRLPIHNRSFWIDVSEYPNINELYWIADILISDYSSAFFDFGLLKKPMICFGYDYEQYEAGNGFLMDLKNEFPNGIKRTEKEVIDYIKTMDYNRDSIKCKEYVDSYVKHPINSTKICIDRLYELLNIKDTI